MVWEGVTLEEGVVKEGPYLISTKKWIVTNKIANIIISDTHHDIGLSYIFLILLNLSRFLKLL